MSLEDRIKSDTTEAIKAHDSLRADTLRGVLSGIHNEEIALHAKSEELDDSVVQSVLQKEAKKRKEAIDIYTKAGRDDLAKKEKDELDIISTYLPAQLNEDELLEIVKKAVETEGGDNFGKVMQKVMKEVGGRAEARLVTEIVKSETGGR